MPFEVELKYRVANSPELARALRSLEARSEPPLVEEDTYFAHPARSFEETDEAVRLRRSGAQNHLTYKGPKVDARSKTRVEVDLRLANGAESAARARELLERLGFRPVASVRKTRQVSELQWQGWPVEIALDAVERLGSFVELETAADEPRVTAAREALEALADRLGLADTIRESYLELLLEREKRGGMA